MEAFAWLSGARRFQCLINFFKVEGVINAWGVLWVPWAVWNLVWSMKIITGQYHTVISVWPLILSQCLGVFWSLLVLSGGWPWAHVAQNILFPSMLTVPSQCKLSWGPGAKRRKKVPSLKREAALSPPLLCPHRLLWFFFLNSLCFSAISSNKEGKSSLVALYWL